MDKLLPKDSSYGWPITAFGYADGYNGIPVDLGLLIVLLAVNSGVALVILFAVWLVCEWLIGRRAARKGA